MADAPENLSPRQQCAALPYTTGAHGPMVLLVTSRETHRWVLPKGWPQGNLTVAASAAAEAFEEAGVTGEIATAPIGVYHYPKRLADGTQMACAVTVFSLRVTRQWDDWPERAERERRWFTPTVAAQQVDEPELRALLRGLAASGNGIGSEACRSGPVPTRRARRTV